MLLKPVGIIEVPFPLSLLSPIGLSVTHNSRSKSHSSGVKDDRTPNAGATAIGLCILRSVWTAARSPPLFTAFVVARGVSPVSFYSQSHGRSGARLCEPQQLLNSPHLSFCPSPCIREAAAGNRLALRQKRSWRGFLGEFCALNTEPRSASSPRPSPPFHGREGV